MLGPGIKLCDPHVKQARLYSAAAQSGQLMHGAYNHPADTRNSPIRNRIVAGMTLGTMLISGSRKTGSAVKRGSAVKSARSDPSLSRIAFSTQPQHQLVWDNRSNG